MKRLCLVVLGLAILVLMSRNVFAGQGFIYIPSPDHLYCTCLDQGDLTVLNLERATCDFEATELDYQHGVLLPKQVTIPGGEECDECDVGVLYECLGVEGTNVITPPYSPRVRD